MKYTVSMGMSRDLAIELLTKEDYKYADLKKLTLEELIKVGVEADIWRQVE